MCVCTLGNWWSHNLVYSVHYCVSTNNIYFRGVACTVYDITVHIDTKIIPN